MFKIISMSTYSDIGGRSWLSA